MLGCKIRNKNRFFGSVVYFDILIKLGIGSLENNEPKTKSQFLLSKYLK